MFFGSYHDYQHYLDIKKALQQSQCQVAEGVVTQFGHPYQWSRTGVGEMFVVDGTRFSYREGSAQHGFHQLGIIREGMRVRIFYYDWHDGSGDIARLEIAQ